MGFLIVCDELPVGDRPDVSLSDIADPNDLLVMVGDLLPYWVEQDALWAAAVAAHLHGNWPRIDVRPGGVRGSAYWLPENWRITSLTKLRLGLESLVNRGLLLGGVDSGDIRFTTRAAQMLVRPNH